MRLSRSVIPAAVLVMLAASAGCGGDDEPTTGSPAPGATTSQADGGETDSPSGGLSDICTEITDAEVADLVGKPVTRQEVPGGGCNFTQDDPRAVSIVFNTTPFDEGSGGFEGAVAGVSGTLVGDAGEEIPAIGDEAFVKTGTLMGGESIKGGGVVHVGGILVQVTLLQAEELAAPKVKALVVEALTLAASKV